MRIFGMAILVVAVWVALEVYTEGLDNAFGGVFASSPTVSGAKPELEDQVAEADRWLGERSADRVADAIEAQNERIARQLED